MIPNPCYKCTNELQQLCGVPPRPVPISLPFQRPPSCAYAATCGCARSWGTARVGCLRPRWYPSCCPVPSPLTSSDSPAAASTTPTSATGPSRRTTPGPTYAATHTIQILESAHTERGTSTVPVRRLSGCGTSLHAQERSTSRQQPALGVVNPSLRGKKCGGVLLLVASAFPEGIEKGAPDRAKFLDDHSSTAG